MTRYLLAIALLATSVTALPAQDKDIVDTAVAAGSFKTLVAAVTAGELVETLKGKGPFTVFAPTDAAFAKVPKEKLASLLKPENKAQLQSILTYHVISGKVMAGDVLKVGEAKTVQGSSVQFSLNIGGAKIIKTDIKCSNGVIHVIDAVIMPPKKEAKKVGANPMHTIQQVVLKGSELFNNGHHGQCADLYSHAMVELSEMEGIHDIARNEIRQTMNSARHTADETSRAWVLRRGLDTLYHQVSR